MAGDSAPIHDRFLVLDNDIWLLGSSLNEFGERGTATVRLPYAPEPLENIERVWGDARPLEEFVTDCSGSPEP